MDHGIIVKYVFSKGELVDEIYNQIKKKSVEDQKFELLKRAREIIMYSLERKDYTYFGYRKYEY